mgnify:CR=1 FL=1
MRILVVEDDRDISSAICKVLKLNNFYTDAVYDGVEALKYLDYDEYDCVILDIMMPRLDGLSTVKKMRERNDFTPVIILTAKADIDDKVLGLDTGADDYLSKPFSMKELVARVKALTRRKNTVINKFEFGNVTLNTKTFEMSSKDSSVRLLNKEYQLMEMLMVNSNILLSTDKIMNTVWGFDNDSEINVVWVNISSLRKKLASINANITIKAVRGLGYSLEVIDDQKA